MKPDSELTSLKVYEVKYRYRMVFAPVGWVTPGGDAASMNVTGRSISDALNEAVAIIDRLGAPGKSHYIIDSIKYKMTIQE